MAPKTITAESINRKEKRMFEIESEQNGKIGMPLSASDQKIIYRQLFTPVKVTLLGKEYMIQPPSPFMGRVIADFKLSYFDTMMKEAETAKALGDSTKSDGSDVERVNFFKSIFKEMFRIKELKKTFAKRYVQLILLDSVKPEWKEKYDDFPPENELDAIITYRQLDRFASEAEMATLLEIYEQMQEPALEKNFERWGATEMLMRSSPGRDSGQQPQ